MRLIDIEAIAFGQPGQQVAAGVGRLLPGMPAYSHSRPLAGTPDCPIRAPWCHGHDYT